MLMAAILLLGLIGYELLPVAALPNVDSPTIQVTAQLPGADAQTVAGTVTTPLERQFGQIPGLTQMTSSSAHRICRDHVAIRSQPHASIRRRRTCRRRSTRRPAICRRHCQARRSIGKTNPADTPVLMLALTSETLPLTTVSDYANSILAQKISQMPGVGLVGIGGEQNPAIRVQVNPAQLAAEGLDLEAVRTALATATVDQPKGTLYGAKQAFALQTNDQLMTAQGFNNYILANRPGSFATTAQGSTRSPVPAPTPASAGTRARCRPCHRRAARCEPGRLDEHASAAIIIAVQRQPGANVIATVDQIKKALPQLEASLPPSLKIHIVSDRTQTIRASVADVQYTLLLTIVLVVGVIFLFLRKLWATVIPAIIGADVADRHVRGHVCARLQPRQSVADGADDRRRLRRRRCDRHDREHRAPHRGRARRRCEAALQGAGEIGFTIMSISISLIAVFIPLFLMSGIVGLLFREFAVTVVVAILVSVDRLADLDADDVRPPPDGGGRAARAGLVSRGARAVLRRADSRLTIGDWWWRCAIASSP